MGALIGGIIAVVIGVIGIVRWPTDLLVVLKGSVPLMIALGGLLAIIAGITSIKDSIEAKKLEQEAQQSSSSESSETK